MTERLELELRVLDDRLRQWGLPSYGSDVAAGVDLRACIDAPVAIEPQAPATMISSGLAILINRPDVAAFILPRSGLGARSGIVLAHSVGLIDPDYSGPWLIPVINRNALGTPPVLIEPGARIAQAVFVPVLRPSFRIVETFSAVTDRGSGGFGSTG